MRPTYVFLLSLALLIGFLPATARAEVTAKTLRVAGGKRSVAASVVKASDVNAANPSGTGEPAASSASGVLYFDSKEVAAGLAKTGVRLYDGDGGKKNYEVHLGHRDGPAPVDIHTVDTDVYYVVQGKATLVTGGTVVGRKPTIPNQEKGTAIEGGEAHQLSQGDMIIIPKGVPHWFKEVAQAPFLYVVVKVR